MSKAARTSAKPFDRSIVEGPIPSVVWKIAWPTMLQNILGGLQGIVDHAMVGHFVGFAGNAAIGVAWQIFLVVMVFISSLFTGMGVLVARFVGARDPEKVNRTVYQAFLTAAIVSIAILAPLGYFLSPSLLRLVNAAPEVQAEALLYLRIMFMFSFGMIVYFMVGGALRSAGDAQTPLRLGIMLTALNITLNVILIPGLGPIPAFGTTGAAMGTVIAGGLMAVVSIYLLFSGKWVVGFDRAMDWRPDFAIIRELFRFGIPTGLQGVAMNVGGVMLLAYIGSLQQSAEAQAAYVISYTQLFSLITWTSAGLLGATAAVSGQNLGAGRPERTIHAVSRGLVDRARGGHDRWRSLPRDTACPPGVLRRGRSARHTNGRPSALDLERIRPVRYGGARLYRGAPRDRRHEESILHFGRLAAHHPDRHLRRTFCHREPPGDLHMACHPHWAHDPMRTQRHPVPAGQVARYQGEYRTGKGVTKGAKR